MPLYMDVHSRLPEGTTVLDVASAHERDLQIQGRYDVRYLNYWVDEDARIAWCLVEAPTKEAANTVHREAHGLVADEIYAVHQG